MNGHEKKTILLVEDEAVIAVTEKMQLAKTGYLVHTVNSGEKAVQAVFDNAYNIDLILMDIDLGSGIDGTETAEQILGHKDIPIVFLSSHTEPHIVEKTENITSYGYVVKNSGIVVLDASIKMALKLFDEKIERKRAENAVLLSEENYRFQFMNMNSYNSLYEVLTGKDGKPYDFRFIMVNYAYEEYVGKKASELIGRTLLEVYPNTEQYWIDKMSEAVITGLPVHFRNFSREMNTYTEVNLYIPQKGQLAMTTGNINERKKAEEELRRSEEKFRALHQSMMDAYVSVDMDGWIIDCNESYLKLLGYNREEISRLTYNDITPGKWHAFEAGIVEKQVMPNGYSEIYEKEYRKKDGTVFPVELRTILMRDADGSPVSMWAIVRDITGRKQAEESLRESELTFRKLFEDSADAILLIDQSGVFVECNQAALALLKMTREQFLFRPPVDISPEFQADGQNSRDKALEMIDLAYEKGLHRFDWTCINSEGDEFIVEVSLMPLKIRGELMLHTTWRDITERKKIENRLINNQQELRKVQEIAHIGTWHMDTATNDVIWTEELYKMYGFDPTQPVPPYTEHMKLFTAESWEILSTSLARTRETGIPYELELQTVRKDGTNGWMWVRGEAVKDENGKITGLWGAAQDITERKWVQYELLKTKEKAEKNEKKFYKVLEFSPIPIAVADKEGVVVFLNRQFIQTFGYTLKELASIENWNRVAYPDIDYRKYVVNDWIKTVEEAVKYNMPTSVREYDVTCKSGEIKTVAISAFFEEEYSIGTFNDITEKKKIEKEIYNQLAEKETLLREVHHRIKNNMANVEGLLQLQADSIGSPEAKTVLHDSITRIQSMRILYDKLLLTKDYQDISFKSYVEALIDSITAVFVMEKKITIERHFIDFSINSKRAISVGIIINELLTNVFKYAFAGRESGIVSISIDKTEDIATLIIQDNGKGIDKNVNLNKSPGLGFTIVNMLTEQLNGTYTVISENGTKSIIRFQI